MLGEVLPAARHLPLQVLTMKAQDIYIRLTDPTGKHKPVVNQHRVWDRDRFVANQQRQYGEAAKPGDERLVTVVSRDDYTAYRKGN